MNHEVGNGALPVPGEADWEHHPDDLDWVSAREMFFGMTLEQAAPLFADNPIERTDELRFMPRGPFGYYIRAFAAWLDSPQFHESVLPCSAASCFLNLLEEKLQQADGCMPPELVQQLLPVATRLAASQQELEADEDIYGSFPEQLERIRKLAGA